jgi:hypothetical protein
VDTRHRILMTNTPKSSSIGTQHCTLNRQNVLAPKLAKRNTLKLNLTTSIYQGHVIVQCGSITGIRIDTRGVNSLGLVSLLLLVEMLDYNLS